MAFREAERELEQVLRDQVADDWLQGDALRALAQVRQLPGASYRVTGLAGDGSQRSRLVRTALFMLDDAPGEPFVGVRGGRPDCAAVRLFRAARSNYAWLAVTERRMALLRLEDAPDPKETEADRLSQLRQERSVGGLVRGVRALVTSTASDAVERFQRPPLRERPQDAVLGCPFEVDYSQLRSIQPWTSRRLRNDPSRVLQIEFRDESWARLSTNEAGAATVLAAGPG